MAVFLYMVGLLVVIPVLAYDLFIVCGMLSAPGPLGWGGGVVGLLAIANVAAALIGYLCFSNARSIERERKAGLPPPPSN